MNFYRYTCAALFAALLLASAPVLAQSSASGVSGYPAGMDDPATGMGETHRGTGSTPYGASGANRGGGYDSTTDRFGGSSGSYTTGGATSGGSNYQGGVGSYGRSDSGAADWSRSSDMRQNRRMYDPMGEEQGAGAYRRMEREMGAGTRYDCERLRNERARDTDKDLISLHNTCKQEQRLSESRQRGQQREIR